MAEEERRGEDRTIIAIILIEALGYYVRDRSQASKEWNDRELIKARLPDVQWWRLSIVARFFSFFLHTISCSISFCSQFLRLISFPPHTDAFLLLPMPSLMPTLLTKVTVYVYILFPRFWLRFFFSLCIRVRQAYTHKSENSWSFSLFYVYIVCMMHVLCFFF